MSPPEYDKWSAEHDDLVADWNRAAHNAAGAIRRNSIMEARKWAKTWAELKDRIAEHLKAGEAAGWWQT